MRNGSSFKHSANSSGCLQSARLSAEDIAVNKTDKNVCPHGVYIPMWKADRYNKK